MRKDFIKTAIFYDILDVTKKPKYKTQPKYFIQKQPFAEVLQNTFHQKLLKIHIKSSKPESFFKFRCRPPI